MYNSLFKFVWPIQSTHVFCSMYERVACICGWSGRRCEGHVRMSSMACQTWLAAGRHHTVMVTYVIVYEEHMVVCPCSKAGCTMQGLGQSKLPDLFERMCCAGLQQVCLCWVNA